MSDGCGWPTSIRRSTRGRAFENYDDNLEHSVWLTMIRDRLVQIRHLLSEDGSVWLHLDDTQMHRARCVLDEVFGASNFVANVIWQKTYTRENRDRHLHQSRQT